MLEERHHLYSIETLIHYRCASQACRQYWSISASVPRGKVTCPACGVLAPTAAMAVPEEDAEFAQSPCP